MVEQRGPFKIVDDFSELTIPEQKVVEGTLKHALFGEWRDNERIVAEALENKMSGLRTKHINIKGILHKNSLVSFVMWAPRFNNKSRADLDYVWTRKSRDRAFLPFRKYFPFSPAKYLLTKLVRGGIDQFSAIAQSPEGKIMMSKLEKQGLLVRPDPNIKYYLVCEPWKQIAKNLELKKFRTDKKPKRAWLGNLKKLFRIRLSDCSEIKLANLIY